MVSLKAFHLVFISVSTILAVGFAVWALDDYRVNGGAASLIGGGISALAAGVLPVYGRWFMRKLKGVKCV